MIYIKNEIFFNTFYLEGSRPQIRQAGSGADVTCTIKYKQNFAY